MTETQKQQALRPCRISKLVNAVLLEDRERAKSGGAGTELVARVGQKKGGAVLRASVLL